MTKWRPAEWVLFTIAALLFISLLLPWIKQTAVFDRQAMEAAVDLAEETDDNPWGVAEVFLPRENQLHVAMNDFLRGNNAYYIFSQLRSSNSELNESRFFVGHLLGPGNYTEKAYIFLLIPILTIATALVALGNPKGMRLAAYVGAALFFLFLVTRIRILVTDGQREIVGVALGPGFWLWMYCTLFLCVWLILRSTFPKLKFF